MYSYPIESKHIIKSKTLWFNILMPLLTVIADQNELIRAMLSDKGYLVLMFITAIGNAYLRTITTTPVKIK